MESCGVRSERRYVIMKAVPTTACDIPSPGVRGKHGMFETAAALRYNVTITLRQ